jgi:hypothetical protein
VRVRRLTGGRSGRRRRAQRPRGHRRACSGVLLAINLMKDDPGAAKKLMDALVTK